MVEDAQCECGAYRGWLKRKSGRYYFGCKGSLGQSREVVGGEDFSLNQK